MTPKNWSPDYFAAHVGAQACLDTPVGPSVDLLPLGREAKHDPVAVDGLNGAAADDPATDFANEQQTLAAAFQCGRRADLDQAVASDGDDLNVRGHGWRFAGSREGDPLAGRKVDAERCWRRRGCSCVDDRPCPGKLKPL
ncbi:MAG: hypothetical protein U5Q44_09445 [Dehalococcoidia bacterium]|nr:hypothetical protein [Dehalococcoidia bacterium]